MCIRDSLYEVLKEKDALYEKEDFSEEDGIRAADLEAEFAELGGWDAETEAGKLLQGLGLDNMMLYSEMSSLTEAQKVKVLLARDVYKRQILEYFLPAQERRNSEALKTGTRPPQKKGKQPLSAVPCAFWPY